MSVNTYLSSLSSNLVLSGSEQLSIKTSIATLSARLNYYFGSRITSQFQFGSSTRGTILPRKADQHSDIDYMVIFDISEGKKTPQTYLDRLKRFTEERYSTSERSQAHPTIVLSLDHIKFELVPAILHSASYLKNSPSYLKNYSIPSPPSNWMGWIETNPSQINLSLQNKNVTYQSQIKPLVRLVKYWNAKNEYPFSSFSLETHIINQAFWNCPSLKDYFYQFWNGFSYPYYGTPQCTKDKVDRAKKVITEAKAYEAAGMTSNAESHIQKILPLL
jgi:Second Messenger Oligonucleotide or Dinucleotide Synthetase domain